MMEFTSRSILEYARLGMRKAFGLYMIDLVSHNENIIVMAADISSSSNLGELKERFPEQFINVGIAEQNMAGIASGLAKEGFNVFIVSFAPFVTMRDYEAIRTLIGYMHLNVKIVALASGFTLGVQGNTHYSLEDLSLFRTIPGMKIFSPADIVEEERCLEYLANYEGPAFLRLTGIDGSSAHFKSDYVLSEDGISAVRAENGKVVILSTGSLLSECIRSVRLLKKSGIICDVYNFCRLKPLNVDRIIELLQRYDLVFTIEEHFRTGGFGSAICEIACDSGVPRPRITRLGINDEFPHASTYKDLLSVSGLNAESIARAVIDNMSSEEGAPK